MKRSGALLRVGGAIMTTVLGLTLTASWAPAAGEPGAACLSLQVHNTTPFGSSTLTRVEFPDGRMTPLAELGYHVNAIGYSRQQDLVYGMADRHHKWPFPDGTHVVTIDRHGQVADRGPLRLTGAHRPPLVVLGAAAGAVVGNRWYVRAGIELYSVDVDPGSPSYLGLLDVTRLRPASLAVQTGDFDVDPVDGLLYGVSTSHGGSGDIVSIDPGTGSMRVVPGMRLPASTTFGAVVIGPDQALYVTANLTGGHSRLYRVERRGAGSVTAISSGPALVSADAAGCLVTPGTPPAPEPEPPAPVPPPPSPAPPSTTISPTSQPEVVPPVGAPPEPPSSSSVPTSSSPVPTSSSVSTTTPSSPVAGTSQRARPDKETVEAVSGENRTEVKRQWALALLLVLFGAGAAARGLRRSR